MRECDKRKVIYVMKIKDGYIMRNVAGNYIVVPVGEKAVDFNGLITTNETGAFIWNLLAEGTTQESIVNEMLKEYEVESSVAETDVQNFIDKLKKADLLA